jgi:1A family penicillin-binding protein
MNHIFVSFKNLKHVSRTNRWKFFGILAAYAFLAVFLFVLGIFLYFAKDLPSPDKLKTLAVVEFTKIYDRTGEHILYEVHGEEKRTVISFQDIPDSVKFATIALEDQEFYSHHGIKLSSIVRAALKDIFGKGNTQGGSTITQQFVKKSMLTDEKTFSRKIKEAILSFELEAKYSKDEILEMYLNQIPYGSNAYGIEAAAQTFFGKSARELTLDESALLAALPQAPSYYSPNGSHPDALKGRQEYALKQMAALGYITQEEAENFKGVDVLAKIKAADEGISAPHFVMYIKEYLEKNYGQQAVEQGGLKVYTTLDWDKQQIAEKAVREGAESNLKKYNAENASLVALDPKTGQILAMVGSKNYFDKSIDGQVNVAIRDRQPGSSFKPYVYLTAFKKGYTPDTQLWDVDTNFETDEGKNYNPKNYDGKNRGLLKMKDALAMSLNVPAVETLYLAGVKESIETAHDLGITTINDPKNVGLSLVLGGGEVKLLEHVNAFATLATGGIYHPKTAILKILSPKGEVLEEYKTTEEKRVVDEKYVAMLDSIISNNDLREPVFGKNNPLRFDGRPVAAKTGTTNEWRDGWTMGYTPSLAVGVWAGNNDNAKMAEGADGVYVAAPIWRAFMDQALKNYPIEDFPKYDKEDTGKDILDGKLELYEKIEVCEIPGKKDKYCLATSACPDNKKDEKKFFNGHTILWYVKKDDPQGDKPKNPEDDPQFKKWEEAVQDWAKKQKGLERDEAPEDDCKSSDFENYKPSLSITSPNDGETISDSSFTIKVDASAEFGLKNISFYVEGDKACSGKDSSCSYSVRDDDKFSTLKVKAVIQDEEDNEASDEISIKIP